MQIHNDGHLHWVCSHFDEKGRVSLYDSLYMEDLDTQLALLYRREVNNLIVHLINSSKEGEQIVASSLLQLAYH